MALEVSDSSTSVVLSEALEASPALLAAQTAFLSAAQSLILERQKFARRFHVSGFDQFSGTRRVNEVLGYPSSLSFEDYRDRFENGGIARRIVLMGPEAMGWSKVAIVEDNEAKKQARAQKAKQAKQKKDAQSTDTQDVQDANANDNTDAPNDSQDPILKNTPLEDAWISLCKRLGVGNVFKRADIQAGIGEYSVIYIGVKEKTGANPKSSNVDILATEMPRLSGPDDVAFLRPLPQDQAPILEFVGDSPDDRVDDPRFGLPKYYNIQLSRARRHIAGTGPASLNSTIRKVHWSRVIHVTHEPLDNEIYSTPELQPIWRYLCDLDKLVGGGSEIFWKQALQKVLFDLDKDIGPDGTLISGTTPVGPIDPAKLAAFKESKEQLKAALEEMEHNLRSSVLSRGVTPKTFNGTVTSFAEDVKTVLGLIAATKNKPQRKLMGSERGHLASTQDEKSDNDTIAARQDEYGAALVRDFVNRLIKYNGLPTPKSANGDYDVEWPTEDEMSELDKAKLVNLLTLANLNQFKADGTVIQTNNEIRDSVYDMDALESPEESAPASATPAKSNNAEDLNIDLNADPKKVQDAPPFIPSLDSVQ